MNGVGLARECTPARTGGEQAGPINPITGLRARPGGLYATVLNGLGATNGRAGQGLLGGTALGQAINNGGGLFATAEESGNFQTTTASAQSSVPGWAVAVIVIGSILLVALIVVSVQLTLLIRNS
jgi:hypothetical protein